jgi:3-oxoacyl-[acyl-carrier protein] reductase
MGSRDRRFAGKVALVTGAGAGIGQAIAGALAAEGAAVAINDRDPALVDAVVAGVRAAGGQALTAAASVADPAAVAGMVGAVVDAAGRIDILVNNAGVVRPAMVTKMTDEEWTAVLDVNLRGAFHCLREVGKHFLGRGRAEPDAKVVGKVVNVTSIAALRGTVGQLNYAAAKAGLIGATLAAAREWAPQRILVNAVAFGVVATTMTAKLRGDPKLSKLYLEQIPLGRFAEIADVVPPVLFLAGPDSDYVTGTVLNVSGGFVIGG